jgi:hypothetical protein
VSSAAKQALTGHGQDRALGLRARVDGFFIVSQTASAEEIDHVLVFCPLLAALAFAAGPTPG